MRDKTEERLVRFYVGTWAASLGNTMAIWPSTVLSDHAPASICIRFQTPSTPRRGCHIPDRVLSREVLSEQIHQILTVDASQFDCAASMLATCITESSIACRLTTHSERSQLHRRERALHVSDSFYSSSYAGASTGPLFGRETG